MEVYGGGSGKTFLTSNQIRKIKKQMKKSYKKAEKLREKMEQIAKKEEREAEKILENTIFKC